MNTDFNESKEYINSVTHQNIGCAYRVSNGLGVGFVEKVYENALAHELRKADLHVAQQYGINVQYDGLCVGQFVTDLLVQKQVIVELKAIKTLDDVHAAQCLNYLRATGYSICLLINFGRPKIQIKRILPHYNWQTEK
jgi:GxxExxY protein